MSMLIDARRDPGAALGDGGAVVTDRERREQGTTDAIRRMRQPGCTHAERDRLREQVVRWQLPLAHRLARGYRNRGENVDDLQQVAALALVKAIDGYDPDRGATFIGYATPTILGELKRHFRDRVWSVHVPRQLQERCLAATRVRTELMQRLQRSPAPREVADALGVTEAEVRATEASTSAYRADSLNRRVGFDQDSGERQDMLGGPDPGLENVCDRVTVRDALETLPGRARYVVHRYYFDHRTQDQIAAELGTSQMTVSRMLAQTLAELRARLSAGATEGGGVAPATTLRVRTYEARPGCLVVAVVAPAGEFSATELRAALVDVAVTRRPRTLVIDLRRFGHPTLEAARVLVDTYRACGHVGASLHVLNVGPELFEVLHRAGVTRLFPCRPIEAVPAQTPAAARPATTSASAEARPDREKAETPEGSPHTDGPAPASGRDRRCSVTRPDPPLPRAIPAGPRAPHPAPRPGAPRSGPDRRLRGLVYLSWPAARQARSDPVPYGHGRSLRRPSPDFSSVGEPPAGSGRPRPPPPLRDRVRGRSRSDGGRVTAVLPTWLSMRRDGIAGLTSVGRLHPEAFR